MELAQGEFLGKQVKPHWAAAHTALEALSGVVHDVVVVERQVRHFVHRHPVHAVVLPFLGPEIVGVHERVMGDVHDAATWMAEDLAKSSELFHHAGVVVPEQVVEHLLGGEEEFLVRLQVAAGQKQCAFKGGTRAFGQQNFQVHAVEAKHHHAGGQRHVEIGFLLREVYHVAHEVKLGWRFEVAMQRGVDVQNRDEKMWITVVKGSVPFGPMFDAPSPQSTSSSNRPRDLVRAGVPAIPGAKIQPQAKELEEVVLGAMMVEKSAVNAVIDVLQPESFYVEAYGEVFRAIQTLFNNSEPIDLLTVTEQLRKDGKLDMLGGSHRVASLTSRVASSANVEFHARIIAQKHIQRELIRVSNAIIEKAYDETSDVFDLLDEAESKLFEVAEGNIRKSYESMSTVMRQALDDIEAARNNEDGVSGVPSGFHDLDKITGGWQRSDMIVLAARPGMGKTAFVLSMARNMAVDHDIPVAVFSLEMSAVQLVQRLISSETEINSDKFRKGNLEEHEYQQLHSRCGKLSKAPLFIDDTPGLNIFELRAKCRRLKAQHGIDMVIIDYLQLMSAGSDKGNREQEISSISRSIKGIAKELDVPIIALSQLSRNVETRGGDKRPLLSDLRESGAIEQDADIVAFIYRAEYYGITEHPDGIDTAGLGELILAKHRHGALDTIKMKFVKNLAKFANYDTFGDLGMAGGAMQPNAAFGAPVTKTLPSKMNDDPISGDDAPF